MKLYKLSQGSTFENLKHFIYITNEYGVPSSEFVDAFIDQFGKDILDKYFSKNHLTDSMLKQLDVLWKNIVQECIINNTEYNENYGNLFYYTIGNKAVDKIKEGWEDSEWNQLTELDKLELLKQFIIDFDKYITDGIDMTNNLFFENTPELIKIDRNGKEYIKIHINEADRGLCTARLYRDSTTIIEVNSRIGNMEQSAIDRPSLYHRIMKARNGHVKNNVAISEIVCKSPSGAGQVYRGFTCNGWIAWYNENGEPIDYYREQNVLTSLYIQRINANKQDKETETAPIQHYILKTNYREQGADSLIGGVLFISGKKIGIIVSDTEININGLINLKMMDDVTLLQRNTNIRYSI